MKKTKIDAVKMVRHIRDNQYEQTKNMSLEEKKAYYQGRAKALFARLTNLLEKENLQG
jgi:hypothetical protein